MTSTATLTNNGSILKCRSPVHLAGGRDAAGNISLQWVRRTRVNGTWLNGVDVPLGEATEAYVVTLYTFTFPTDSVVVQFNTTAPTLFFSAADQTTYYGGLVGSGAFEFGVQQIGANGAGFEARKVI